MNIKTMNNNQLFKAVVESQNAMKAELLVNLGGRIDGAEKELKSLRKDVDNGFK